MALNFGFFQSGEIASIRLSNRDAVRIGSTEFVMHIHPGTDTCSDCEPGVIHAQTLNQATTNQGN